MKLSLPFKVVVYTLLGFFTLYFLFPFFWMLLSALKTEGEIFRYPPTFWPQQLRLQNK